MPGGRPRIPSHALLFQLGSAPSMPWPWEKTPHQMSLEAARPGTQKGTLHQSYLTALAVILLLQWVTCPKSGQASTLIVHKELGCQNYLYKTVTRVLPLMNISHSCVTKNVSQPLKYPEKQILTSWRRRKVSNKNT